MVQQIVAGRDGGEHGAHGAGGGLRVGGAFGGSAEDCGFGGVRHVGNSLPGSVRPDQNRVAARDSPARSESPVKSRGRVARDHTDELKPPTSS